MANTATMLLRKMALELKLKMLDEILENDFNDIYLDENVKIAMTRIRSRAERLAKEYTELRES